MTSFTHLAKTSLAFLPSPPIHPTTPLGPATCCYNPISFLIDDLLYHPISSFGSSGLGHRHSYLILISFTHMFTISHSTPIQHGSAVMGLVTERWTRAIESRPSGLVNSLAKLWTLMAGMECTREQKRKIVATALPCLASMQSCWNIHDPLACAENANAEMSESQTPPFHYSQIISPGIWRCICDLHQSFFIP